MATDTAAITTTTPPAPATEASKPPEKPAESTETPRTLGGKPFNLKAGKPSMPSPSMLMRKPDAPKASTKPADAGATAMDTELDETDEPAAQADEPGEKPKSQDKPKPADGGHNLDKGVQRLQQEVGNLKRAVDTILEKVEQQGGQATAAQAKQLADAQEEIDDLKDLMDSESEGFLERSDATRLAKKLDALSKEVADLRAENTRLTQAQQQVAQQEQADRQFWSDFASEHPELEGQEQALLDRAAELLTESADDLEPGSPEYNGAARFAWKQAVKEAQAKAQAEASAKAEVKKKPAPAAVPPPSTKPDKSPVGASVLASSAARTGNDDARNRLAKARAGLIKRA
jgi:polyhydroxyalkanoate synthesis regulator phasin